MHKPLQVAVFLLLAGLSLVFLFLTWFPGATENEPRDEPGPPGGTPAPQFLEAAGPAADPTAPDAEKAHSPVSRNAPGIEETLATFDNWLREFRAGSATEREALAEHGAGLARDRRETMAELIENDPEKALRHAVPRHVRNELPASVREHLEIPIDTRGDFFVSTACDFTGEHREHRQDTLERHLTLDGDTFRASVYGRREAQPTKLSIPVHGIRIGNTVAIHDQPFRLLESRESRGHGFSSGTIAAAVGDEIRSFDSKRELERFADEQRRDEQAPGPFALLSADGDESSSESDHTATTAESSWTTGEKRLLYIRVDFPDHPGNPVDLEGAEADLATAAEFFADNSGGNASLEGKVVSEIVRMPRESHVYTSFSGRAMLRNDALAAAQELNDEYDPNEYDLDTIVFSIPSGLPYWGAAHIGARGLWLNSGTPDSMRAGVLIHELGHNLGLHHASAWRPSSDDPIGPGDHVEYGDPADAMANASPDNPFNAFFKAHLNWLEPGDEWKEVHQSGVYRIHRHDTTDGDGLKGLRLGALENDYYWVDIQEDSWGQEGVAIRREKHQAPPQSALLDLNPTSNSGLNDYALRTGNIFEDAEQDLSIRILEIGGDYPDQFADVEVIFDTPPRFVAQPEGTISTSGEEIELSVRIGGLAPFEYQWFRDGEPVDGESGPQLRFPSAQTNDGGLYHVEVSNSHGVEESEAVWVNVLDADAVAGRPDTNFDPDLSDGEIQSLIVDTEDRILVGGDFAEAGGVKRPNLVRLQPDGELDPSFTVETEPPSSVRTLVLQDDGGILAAGGEGNSGWIKRYLEDGRVDAAFSHGPRANGEIASLAISPGGKIVAGGRFTTFDNEPTGPLVRLQENGKLDESFITDRFDNPDREYAIEVVTIRPDGRVTVTGTESDAFTSVPGPLVNRFHSDGSVDSGFSYSLPLRYRPDGIHLFDREHGQDYLVTNADQAPVQRLQPDGTATSEFNPALTRGTALGVTLSGHENHESIYLAAELESESPYTQVFRMFPDGRIDPSFRSNSEDRFWIGQIARQSTGRILLAGRGVDEDAPILVRLHGDGDAGGGFERWAKKNGLSTDPDGATSQDPPLLLRYAMGLDPHHPEQHLFPKAGRTKTGNPGHYPTLTYRRLKSAEDVEYIVEGSTNLSDWEPLESVEVLSREPVSDTIETVTIKAPEPDGESPRRFLRLRVKNTNH